MRTATFHFESPLFASDFAVAWAVLLKEYAASPHISFIYGNISGSNEWSKALRSIDLVLEGDERLGKLREEIEKDLTHGSEMSSFTCSSSFPTILCIEHQDSKTSSMIHESLTKQIEEADDCIFKELDMDLKVRCRVLWQHHSARFTLYSESISDLQVLRMLDQFETVLRQVSRAIRKGGSLIDIKTASRSDVRDIWEWNRYEPVYDSRTALDLFSYHAKIHPCAPAVNAWDGDLTYQDLDEASTALSLRLTELGVQRGKIVPLCFEKSLWAPVAIFAVMKTGAAFVLLDEDLPPERLRMIGALVSREMVLVLASTAQYHRAMYLGPTVVLVDSNSITGEKMPLKEDSKPHISPADLIYIIFTSGSSGVPKAAMIRHSNVYSLLRGLRPLSGVTRASRILALAPYAYDVSLENIFLSLLSGACLCIPSSWECKNDVVGIIHNYRISHAGMTPSVAKLIQPSDATTLEVLDLGGEQCCEEALVKWRGSSIRVMNGYGPAECTITSVVNDNVLHSAKASIIGSGLGICWIMDPVDCQQLTPIGAIGELVLEGPLVGAGYLHDSASTKANFFEDPAWLLEGLPGVSSGRRGRLYRTGDLVRYTDHGQIEYVGRQDLQIKLRGQRLELGELAVHLQELMPASFQWCPEVGKFQNGAELLIVFLVLPEDQSNLGDGTIRTTVDLLDHQLRGRLPPVLIPSAYTCINKIPLSLTGKTDHRKLKQIASVLDVTQLLYPRNKPQGFEKSSSDDVVAKDNTRSSTSSLTSHMTIKEDEAENTIMRDRIQTTNATADTNTITTDSKLDSLRHLWSEILHVDVNSIQPSDTFFDLGGESLAAIRLIGAAALKGLRLDSALIFQYPQLFEMASRCKLTSTSFAVNPERFSLLKNTEVLSELAMACGISVNSIEDAYPCTPMQESLMIASVRREKMYVGRGVFKVPQNIDATRLVRAWHRVAISNPILRTRIVDSDDHGILQTILKESELSWSIDTTKLAIYLKKDEQEKMGFGTSLCRLTIVREPSSAHMVLTMHHALYDGWTLPRLGTEVFKAYRGVRLQETFGFNAFIKYTALLPTKEAEDFWASQLAEPARTSFFPTISDNYLKPEADSTTTRTFLMPVNANRSVSLPSLLRAAWALLAAKLSGTNDVSFGMTVSGRNVPMIGIENLLGPTISTIPVKVKIKDEDTVEEFVARVQTEALASMPFENMGLQNIRNINSDTRKGTNFRTLLIMNPLDDATTSDSTLATSSAEAELETMLGSLDISSSLSRFNEYALMVLHSQKDGTLLIEANYDSRVLDSARADLLLDQFVHVAGQLGCEANLARKLKTLNLISNREIESIWSWNSVCFQGRKDLVHDMIARTIAKRPMSQAICAWDGSVTFAEIDQLSSSLAAVLARKGVCRGQLVPICMEKSVWVSIAMLGILKSGAGFVAMDIKHQPEQRLRTIVEEAQADWIVTVGPATHLARKLSPRVIACDYLACELEDLAHHISNDGPASPSDTAFIVFTSGSTGVPKGIIITHENFCSTAEYHARHLRLSKTSRVYDFASYSFDISVHNALMSLIIGACLCVPSESDRHSDIEGSFERLGANWANMTPSVARLLSPAAVPSLKTLVLAGEAIPRDMIKQWASKAEIINAYGPAETQICTIRPDLRVPADAENIGRGVGCSTWILDVDSDSLAPIGAIGELVIEGPIVSPGYLNASGESFSRDPSWLLSGSAKIPGRHGNLYRTGDLAAYHNDGSIIYKGRTNNQTKINGQRIELHEVEFHVRQALPDSHDVVADVVNFDGTSHLCLFLTHQRSGSLTRAISLALKTELLVELMEAPAGLISKLESAVPSFMVPSVCFGISHVPLTGTRKFDRRRLKEYAAKAYKNRPLGISNSQMTSDQPALDAVQQKMLYIWSQVLKVQFSQIDLNSDFFQLGGDSIGAMHIVKDARKLGLSFLVADVFRASKFEDLCSIARDNEHVASENQPKEFFDTVSPFSLLDEGRTNVLINTAAASCDVTAEDVADIYPCSPFQEGVFAMTTTLKQDAYVRHTELAFNDVYDFKRVLAAWDSTIATNSILRTRIVQSEQANLMQVVLRQAHQWQYFESADEYLKTAGKVPMCLGGPLSRFSLVRNWRQSAPGYTMIWTIHHALYDAWTIGLILRQVSETYHGRSDIIPGPEYNVFVRFLEGQRANSESWWQSNLTGAADAAVFPKMPLAKSSNELYCSLRKEIPLPRTLPPGCTIAALLRSAWAVLMARHTQGQSVVFGEIRLGRNAAVKGVENMRGPTTSAVPVLVHIDREQTIKSLLDDIRETNIQMQEFEHLGMQNISQISEDTRAACNFQTILVLQENEDKITADSIFEVNSIDDVRNFNSWELMIIYHRSSKGLQVEALFKESTISADSLDFLLQQNQSILQSICNFQPDTTLRQLDLVNEEDLTRIWDLNSTLQQGVDAYIHDLVSIQARRNPDDLAVLAHDGQFTYKELDEMSSNLAAQISARGIGVGDLVPLCFEKSTLVPIAMLGVMKTGAAFSVMDVTYPESRLKTISHAMEASLILTSPGQAQLAKRLVDNVLVADDVSCRTGCRTGQNGFRNAMSCDTNQIMYICYTSGSTGEPKGVMVTHKNLASASVAQSRELGFGKGDRVYDFSSHSFDLNIWNTFVSLVSGACLCIPSDHDRKENLAGSINYFQTTKLSLTPSVARTVDPKEVPTVKRFILCGEAITKLDVSMWEEHLDLWCAYGPTETTPMCIFTRIQGPETASIIGRGVGINPWICDPEDHNELVAIGAVGELLLEGPLVSQGYRGQPEKTARVFVKDPSFLSRGSVFIPGRHSRLYRTGDLVRYGPNGTIEYIGRADTQIKLRGQRVEFGEIEFHLKNAMGADSSVVCEVITHPFSERPMLVAFYAFSSATKEVNKAGTRTILGKRLPPYMVPEAFLKIHEIPKSVSGKIDRKELKALGSQLLQDEGKNKSGSLHGPHTKMEALLAELWITALGQSRLVVHLDDDFFEVGGESIAVMKLSNLARKHDLNLTVANIMQHPMLLMMAMKITYSEMRIESPRPFSLVHSAQLDQALNQAAKICGIDTRSISDIYPCTPLQVELFALTMKQPQAYMSRTVFEVPSHVSFPSLIQSWNKVIMLNDILRTRFVDIEGLGLMQIVVEEDHCDSWTNLADYLASVPPKADLGSPLSQVAAISEGETFKIVWTIHHAVYDAWSIQIIENQLRKTYQHQPILRPPKYSGFVKHLQSQDLQEAQKFWKLRLQGCTSAAIYPTLPSQDYQVRPSSTFKRVLKTSIFPGMNLQAIVHGAWALTVSKLSETDDVVFAATLSGRDPSIPGIEQMVGTTITPVPIRVQTKGQEQAVQSFLQKIEEETKAMGPYQHIGTKAIELIDSHTQAACKFQTLLVVNPSDASGSDGLNAITTPTYEISSEKQEVFHTFAVVLFFTPLPMGVALEVVFDPAIFSPREVERLSGRLESVINALGQSRSIEVPISKIECLSKEDLADIWSWNAELPPPSEQRLHSIILEQVPRFAEKIAIDAWDIKFSYTQLGVLSEALAVSLGKHGVGHGSIVPLISRKSGYVAVAALSVLRVGATILPLDHSLPLHRKKVIIEQVHPRVILAGKSSLQAEAAPGVTILCIEECLGAVDGTESLPSHLDSTTSDDVACILWTSGTTGMPKGVMQTHGALASAIIHQAADSGFNECTRAFDFASYGFDVSWNMVFKTLAVGGTLCVPSEDERQNDLCGALNRFAATVTELTASVARLVNPDQLLTLETLILSGEYVDLRAFENWTRRVRILICYGPSECTSVSTINKGGPNSGGIGRGTGCVTWIVDPHNHQRLMPIGAIGEVLIEGPNVGKGYYNNEALTKAAYVSELPWLKTGRDGSARQSCMAFKSGDLARYDDHGNLHFISRKDTQVKLYGQRIELEEVQHHVQKVMGDVVTTVVASMIDEPQDGRKLAVFMSCRGPTTADALALTAPTTEALESLGMLDKKLQDLLPKYMVPSIYFFTTTIPCTSNGKVDRTKLVEIALHSSPDQVYRGRNESAMSRRDPSTAAEVKMQQLWAVALHRPATSIRGNDSFFDLNGDSISAMRLVARARSEGYKLSVSDIFAHPRLSDMALQIAPNTDTQELASSIEPYALLGTSIDVDAIRSEVVSKCGLKDPSLVCDVFPCTPLQESMLAATIQDSSAFISMRLYRIPAQIDGRRFQAAWETVVERNPILRTRIVDLKSYGLNQAVLHSPFKWDHYCSIQHFLEKMETEGMGPSSRLSRWALIKDFQGDILIWTIHHTLYDGWSVQIIEKEVKSAYFGQLPVQPQPDLKFFIKYLIQQNKKDSLLFWNEELKNGDESGHFPAVPNHNYKRKSHSFLEKTIPVDLSSLSSGNNLSALLYGSWALLVSRISGNQRVVVGSIRTGRTADIDMIDKIVGPTITTVPIVVNADTTLSVQDFLAQLRDRIVRMIPHEHIGMREIRRISAAAAAACNFQTVLVIQPPAENSQQASQDPCIMEELDETTLEGFPDQHAALNLYGLMIEVVPSGNNTILRASFDPALISYRQTDRMVNQWVHTLTQLGTALGKTPDLALESLLTLSQQDLDDIWKWNENVPEVHSRFIHDVISENAFARPEAPAIDGWNGQLSYHDLDLCSSQLAGCLIEYGIGPGSFVPLIFEKSIWANVSMLAVLKAGATFVPFDSNVPEGRLRAIMQVLDPSLILCSARTRDQATRLVPCALLVDASLKLSASTTTYPTSRAISSSFKQALLPNHLAYLSFSSGSTTGQPKAIKITHQNLATAIRHHAGIEGYCMNWRTRTLDSSFYSFDACVCNFFYTLAQGGCLCVPSEESLRGDITIFIRERRVNFAHLVPSVARTINPGSVPDLSCLVLTGEPMKSGDIDTWGQSVHLLNAFGPTECTILCSISPQIVNASQVGSIGRGNGANLWLTEIGNPHKLAPIGAIGEILIEGPIIGAGYLKPNEYPLVVDPPWLTEGAKQKSGRRGELFRTGDQARYDDDGSLVFIGRIGNEIKLRGQRVDLMEIEDLVRRHDPIGLEFVADVVRLDGDESHERQMLVIYAAYMHRSLADTQEKLHEELQSWVLHLRPVLADALPLYQQPEVFVPVEAIPKTSSGKTDRRSLRNMKRAFRSQHMVWISGDSLNSTGTPPSTLQEQKLAIFWAEVLGLEANSIFREDDFFRLGGDSIAVMRLTTLAGSQDITLKASDVFTKPKLAQLAEQMAEVHTMSKDIASYRSYSLVSEVTNVERFIQDIVQPSLNTPREEIEDILPANCFQVDYIHNKEEPLGLQYAYLDIGPEISWTKFVEACTTVAQVFQCFRSRFIQHEGKYYQVILQNAPILVEDLGSTDQLTTSFNKFWVSDSRQAVLTDIYTKLSLIRTSSGQRRAILRLSHLQNDGWCTTQIFHALASAYNDEKIFSGPDWTQLLHYREQKAYESQKYWQRLLQGTTETTPRLVYKPNIDSANVRTLRTCAVPNFYSPENHSRTRPAVVINVAWALVLNQYSGQSSGEIVVGNVTTGRNGTMADLHTVVGPCVNMVPMMLRLGASSSQVPITSEYLCNLVDACARQMDERIDFEGLGWDEIVKQSTIWPEGTRYSSSVHFRNMEFEPELKFGDEVVKVAWNELVAKPEWTTLLAYPEGDILRLWLLADPAEISDDGADDVLALLNNYIDLILSMF